MNPGSPERNKLIRNARVRLGRAAGAMGEKPQDASPQVVLKLHREANIFYGLTEGSIERVLGVMERANPAFNRNGDTVEQVADEARMKLLREGIIRTAFLAGEVVVAKETPQTLRENGIPSHISTGDHW